MFLYSEISCVIDEVLVHDDDRYWQCMYQVAR